MFIEKQRFRKPITSVECEKFEESWVSDSSRRKWAWVLKVFDQWMVERNEAVNKISYSGEPLINENLDEISDEQLDFVLARFISEVRKEDGQEYPGKTLYEMMSSIQTFLRVKCKRNVTLIDKTGCKFRSLNSALNFQMKEKAGQGIGLVVNKANLITDEQEDYLWENGFFGSENAELLCHTLVWIFDIQFALRAGQEHRNLRFKNSQLSLQRDESGNEFLQYMEDISKTNNGGLSHLRIKRKVVRAYKNLTNVERCPVELYKTKYLSHVPKEISDNAFYLRALPKPNKAMGRETLGNVVKNIMRKAGFEGHFTNHSLRRSCATRLYEGGVPEQVIVETTGHRSCDGVREYKCTSLTLKRKASEILQGATPRKAEIDVKEKNEKLFNNDVEQRYGEQREETGLHGLSEKVLDENQNEDYNQSVVISTHSTKIVISYK